MSTQSITWPGRRLPAAQGQGPCPPGTPSPLQNPLPNAYTLAIAGRKPFIVLHTALLDLLTPAEVQAVLAHELGHLKCDHGERG